MDILKKNERGALESINSVFNPGSDAAPSSSTSLSSSSSGAKAVNAATSAVASLAKNFTDMLAKIGKTVANAAKELTVSSAVAKGLKSIFGDAYGDIADNPTIKQGAKGQPVVELQSALIAAGFGPLTPDGIFGPKTLAAVKAFQTSKSLVSDGIVGPKTWAALSGGTVATKPAVSVAPTAPITTPITTSAHVDDIIKLGDKNAQVLQFQAGINNMGYMSSTGKPALVLDGIFGAKTAEAVKWAEKVLNLPVDGIVDAKLFQSVTSAKAPSQAIKDTNVLSSTGEQLAKSTAYTIGTFSDGLASEMASYDSHILTNSRASTAVRGDQASGLLLDAVISQVMAVTKGQLFSFFSALNPFLPAILRALAWHESGIRNSAVGKAKEVSIFQLHPKTVASLKSIFSLPDLNIANAASLAGYMIAMLKDIDAYAKNYIKKDVTGAMLGGLPGNEHITSILAKLPGTPAVVSQLFTLFLLYNAGPTETYMVEDWRQQEALKRTMSAIMTAGGK